MLLALVLRSLRGWLHDYVGIHLDHSDYHLEHLSSNHVRLELKAALAAVSAAVLPGRGALERPVALLGGPHPAPDRAGRRGEGGGSPEWSVCGPQVELEVNPDLPHGSDSVCPAERPRIRVRIKGVRLRLRKLLPEEWHGEAEAYKTRQGGLYG